MRASGRGGVGSNQYAARGGPVGGQRRADTWEVEQAAAVFDPSSPLAGWVALGSPLEEVDEWDGRGFTCGQASAFMASGLSPGDAERCREVFAHLGLGAMLTLASEAHLRFGAMDVVEACEWVQSRFESAAEVAFWREKLGRDPTFDDVRAGWLDAGFCATLGDCFKLGVGGQPAPGLDTTWKFSPDMVIGARQVGVHDPADLVEVRDRLDPFWQTSRFKEDPARKSVSGSVAAKWHVAGVDPGFGVEAIRLLDDVPVSRGDLVTVGWNEGARHAEAFVAERRARWEGRYPWAAMYDAAGISDTDEAERWHDNDIDSWAAAAWRPTGIDPSEARAWMRFGRGQHRDVARCLYRRGCTPAGAALIVGDIPAAAD